MAYQWTLVPEAYELKDNETPETVRHLEKREQALRLLEECVAMYGEERRKTARFMSKMNELGDLVMEYFLPTHPPTDQEMLDEIRESIFGLSSPDGPARSISPRPVIELCDWRTCYNSTFAVMIARMALRDYKLPFIQARCWKRFVQVFAGLVMAA